MISGLFLIKIAITLAVVIGLSVIAERVSPKIAGILAGYPHGIAIALYFIGIEQGVDFAAQSAIYAIGGLAANLAMCYAYFRLCKSRSWGNIAITAVGSTAVFLLASALLQQIGLGPVVATLITLATIILLAWLMNHAIDVKIDGKPKVGFGAVLIRGGLAAGTVLLITSLANVVGPEWAGLLAGFPIVTFPLLLILHHGYGPAPVATMIRAYPYGIVALLTYALTTSYAFHAFGMGWGTLIGYVAATIYVIAYALCDRRKPA